MTIRDGSAPSASNSSSWSSPTADWTACVVIASPVRRAARAARRTGLAITTHAVQSTVGLDQLDLFEAEGADLSRVVIGHADSNPTADYHSAIIERGASVEFDFLGMSFTPLERHGEGRIVESICDLLARGHAERILLSQDVSQRSHQWALGGPGLTFVFEEFADAAVAAGIEREALELMWTENPRRVLFGA